MKKEETNKLIAEFMKWKKVNAGLVGYETPHSVALIQPSEMLFRNSWDWLIPVKDKVIPLTDDLPSKYYDMIVNGLITGDIHQVYNSCVEVIKLTIKK